MSVSVDYAMPAPVLGWQTLTIAIPFNLYCFTSYCPWPYHSSYNFYYLFVVFVFLCYYFFLYYYYIVLLLMFGVPAPVPPVHQTTAHWVSCSGRSQKTLGTMFILINSWNKSLPAYGMCIWLNLVLLSQYRHSKVCLRRLATANIPHSSHTCTR